MLNKKKIYSNVKLYQILEIFVGCRTEFPIILTCRFHCVQVEWNISFKCQFRRKTKQGNKRGKTANESVQTKYFVGNTNFIGLPTHYFSLSIVTCSLTRQWQTNRKWQILSTRMVSEWGIWCLTSIIWHVWYFKWWVGCLNATNIFSSANDFYIDQHPILFYFVTPWNWPFR